MNRPRPSWAEEEVVAQGIKKLLAVHYSEHNSLPLMSD